MVPDVLLAIIVLGLGVIEGPTDPNSPYTRGSTGYFALFEG